jgi:hypothetical protein
LKRVAWIGFIATRFKRGIEKRLTGGLGLDKRRR